MLSELINQFVSLMISKLTRFHIISFLYRIAASAIVYDSVESSPHYGNSANDLYIDERDLIELPAAHQQDSG